MLGLKLPTDPRWVNIVEKNIADILTDHAYCEQKAVSTAISIAVRFPDKTELVSAMIVLAQEEISHFKLVHDLLIKRGYTLGKERKDEYVIKIMNFFEKGGPKSNHLVHKLLYAALIEARSCERFRLLSENLPDEELCHFYRKLMISEANHYTLFLNFARKYGESKEAVNKKWEELLEFEGAFIKTLGKQSLMHG